MYPLFLRSLAAISTVLFTPSLHIRSKVCTLLKPRTVHTYTTSLKAKGGAPWSTTSVTAGAIRVSGPLLMGMGVYYGYGAEAKKNRLRQLVVQKERAIAYWHERLPDQAEEDLRIKTCLEASKQTYYRQLTALPHGIVAQHYIDQFQQEEENHIKAFYQLIGLTYSHDQWQQTLNVHLHPSYALYRSKNAQDAQAGKIQPCTLSQLNMIDEQLEAHGINSILIQKHMRADDPEYGMAAGYAELYLTADSFKHDARIFNGVVRHEIVHLLHHDYLVRCTMQALFAAYKIDSQERYTFYEKFRNFQEKRADILGTLLPDPPLALDYAHSYRACNKSPIYGHPSNVHKAAYCQEVHDKIVAFAKKPL